MADTSFSTQTDLIHRTSGNPPVHRAASFEIEDADRATAIFSWQDVETDAYSRISNPTVRAFEQEIARLEGGTAAVATASGQAASFLALEGLVTPRTNIVAGQNLFGGTISLMADRFARFGVETRWFDPANPAELDSRIDMETRAIYVETVANPDGAIADLEGLARVAHTRNIPLIVDNTLASPWLCRPIAFGADVVIHSAGKYLNGHGTAIGGVIVDAGRFNWKDDPRYPLMTRGGEASIAARHGKTAFAVLMRQGVTVYGSCLSPDNASLMMTGLKTLPLRMAQHVENAQKVSAFLANHPAIADVRYPGLASHPHHALAKRVMPQGQGAVILATLRDETRVKKVMSSLNLFTHKTNLGETGSLVVHPATTTHIASTPAQKAASGIGNGTLRLMIGLESAADLIQDLSQALEK